MNLTDKKVKKSQRKKRLNTNLNNIKMKKKIQPRKSSRQQRKAKVPPI